MRLRGLRPRFDLVRPQQKLGVRWPRRRHLLTTSALTRIRATLRLTGCLIRARMTIIRYWSLVMELSMREWATTGSPYPERLGRLQLAAIFSALVLVQAASLLAQGGTVPARPAPLGRLVDIGGYRLHLYCTGSGSPTVILMHGFADFSFTWALVQPAVAQVTRVCSYDRAGRAWSDPGPPPRGLQRISDELHVLLGHSGERGPFILVGQSWGGLVPRLYQPQHPADVAGVVFVDASHEDMWMWLNGVTLQPRLASAAEWERIHQPRARRGPPPSVDSAGSKPRSGPPAAPAGTPPATSGRHSNSCAATTVRSAPA